MAIFFPSACPSSYRLFLNASMRVAMKGAEIAVRNPIRGTFVGCCADADGQSAKSIAQRARAKIFRFIVVSSRLTPHHSRLTESLDSPAPARGLELSDRSLSPLLD